MIKYDKHWGLGGEVGIAEHAYDRVWIYRALNTKTQKYISVFMLHELSKTEETKLKRYMRAKLKETEQ